MASRLLLLAVGLTILDGCKFASASKVKHDFGQIANAGDLLISCNPAEITSQPEDAEALRYLKDHVRRLIEANRSVLPKGIENVCPLIAADYEVNAFASAEGIVAINRGLLWMASTDAQIAAVIAHELAHAASLHSIGGRPKGKIVDDKDYQDTQKKLRAVFAEITTEKVNKASESYTRLKTTLNDAVADRSDKKKLANQYLDLLAPFIDRTVTKFDLFMTTSSDRIVQVVTKMPLDSVNREAAWKYKQEEIEFKGYEDLLRMVLSHRVLLLEGMQESKRESFLRDEATAIAEGERYLTSSREYKALRKNLSAIEEKYMGKDVAANWKEQDADEKGLELFIRAGYDPKEYAHMFALLERSFTSGAEGKVPDNNRRPVLGAAKVASSSLASCYIADRVNAEKCDRGSSTHPASCWREQNVFDELKKHEADYAPLLANVKTGNAFGGRLASLQSYYFTATMQGASATAAKASGSCEDVQPDRDTCDDKKAWGQCGEVWMRSNNWCRCTCGY